MAPTLEELMFKYEELYRLVIEDEEFYFRPLTRKEFKMLLNSSIDGFDFEDSVSYLCTLLPEEFDFAYCKAGLPAVLSMAILDVSGFTGTDSLAMLEQVRAQVAGDLDTQMEAVIMHVFPSYKGEEIETWTRKKMFERYVQAEWVIVSLNGTPAQPPSEDQGSVPGLPPPPGFRGGVQNNGRK